MATRTRSPVEGDNPGPAASGFRRSGGTRTGVAGQPLRMSYTALGAGTIVPVGLLMFWLAP
jgi:hypothetical protein